LKVRRIVYRITRPLLRIKPGVDLRLDLADLVRADADRFRKLAGLPFSAQRVSAVVDPLQGPEILKIDELHRDLA